jgi:hypothetical protein
VRTLVLIILDKDFSPYYDEHALNSKFEPQKVNIELLNLNDELLKVNDELLKVNDELLKVNDELLKVNIEPLKVKDEPLNSKFHALNSNFHALNSNFQSGRVRYGRNVLTHRTSGMVRCAARQHTLLATISPSPHLPIPPSPHLPLSPPDGETLPLLIPGCLQ